MTVSIAAIPQKPSLKFAQLCLYNLMQMVRKQKFDICFGENGGTALHRLSHGTSACNVEIFWVQIISFLPSFWSWCYKRMKFN